MTHSKYEDNMSSQCDAFKSSWWGYNDSLFRFSGRDALDPRETELPPNCEVSVGILDGQRT
jgi:hypothetical protein